MNEDLDANYAGAFSGHLQPGRKCALLIVDVVMAYLEPQSPLYAAAESALAANERLVRGARNAGMPVYFTNVEYQAGGADGGYFYRKVPALKAFLKGSPLGAFPATLQPTANDVVITKQYASAFFRHIACGNIAQCGRGYGADHRIFDLGLCVGLSALDALQNGLIPFVVRDACDRPSPRAA